MFKKINDFFAKNLILVIVIIAIIIYLSPDHFKKEHFINRNEDFLMKETVSYKKIGRSSVTPTSISKDSKIIKSAFLEMEVDNMQKTKDEVDSLVKKHKGFITNFSSYEIITSELAYNFTIKVPAENLDILISEISSLGNKKSENFSITDITEQYQDTKNQLKNLEARRDRLRKLLETNTKNLKDILEVDKELSSVQNQIERLERIQNRRDTDISYSTLNLNVVPKLKVEDFTGVKWSINNSFKNSVNTLIFFTQKFTDIVIKIVIFAPFWAGVILIFIAAKLIYEKGNKLKKRKTKK